MIIVRFLADEGGVTSIEYALIASIVSISIVAGATAIGLGLDNALRGVLPGLQ